MGYVRKGRIINLIDEKDEMESYELGTFSLNEGGKNDGRIKAEAKMLTDFKGGEYIHIEGTYMTPFGVCQGVNIFSDSPEDFSGREEFSNLPMDEKEEAIKEGIKENFYDPGNHMVHCSRKEF